MSEVTNALVEVPQGMKPSLSEAVSTYVDSVISNMVPLKNDLANIIIADDKTSGFVANCIKGLTGGASKLEAKKLETTEAMRSEVAGINSYFKLLTDELKAIKATATEAQKVYLIEKQKELDAAAALAVQKEKDRLAALAEELIEVAADEESYPDEAMRDHAELSAHAAEEAIEHVSAIKETAKIGGGAGTSSLSYDYSAEIVDMKAIPLFILQRRKVLEEIQKELNREAKSQKEHFAVDGAKLVKNIKVGTR